MSVQVATDQDFKSILESNEKVVVKYGASWCGQCRLFGPKFKRLSNDERFEGVVFVDIDAESNPEARKLANVNNLPFFAVFRNGEMLEGEDTAKEEKVVGMIEKIL